jgi:hypothetical protein
MQITADSANKTPKILFIIHPRYSSKYKFKIFTNHITNIIPIAFFTPKQIFKPIAIKKIKMQQTI